MKRVASPDWFGGPLPEEPMGSSEETKPMTAHSPFMQVVEHADKFQNQAILFIHFSARYKKKVSWCLLPVNYIAC